MVWQKARETGALPQRLVHPGEVFEWPTLEPWADRVSVREAEAEVNQALEQAQKDAEAQASAASASGAAVTPGDQEEVDPTSDKEVRRKRTAQRQADTP